MDIRKLARFLLWCTIVNGAFLLVSFALFDINGTDFVHRTHGIWFALPPNAVSAILYMFLGTDKIAILILYQRSWVLTRLMAAKWSPGQARRVARCRRIHPPQRQRR